MLEGPRLFKAGTSGGEPDRTLWRLERLVGLLVALTVLVVAAGSAWNPTLKSDVSSLRWVSLLALVCASFLLAMRCIRLEPVTRAELHTGALALALAVLMVISTVWSFDPRLTLERAFTVCLVLLAAGSVALSAARRSTLVGVVARAIVTAIGVLLAASLLLLLVSPGSTLQPSIVRFRGVEENPDTLPLLAAFGLPLGLWLLLEARNRISRSMLALELVAIVVLMGASGSRGGLVGGAAGLVVVVFAAAGSPIRVLAASGAALVILAASLAITPQLTHLPGAKPNSSATPVAITSKPSTATTSGGKSPTTTTTPAAPAPETLRSWKFYPLGLSDELDRPPVPGGAPAAHALFGSSGRVQAWIGAIHQADQRPLLGYGFGTEDRVFIDRFYGFAGDRPESTWVGIYIQLGAIGVAALAALIGKIVFAGISTLWWSPLQNRLRIGAVAGVAAAGLVESFVQSFAVSAGDIAMISFWLCLSLFAAVPRWGNA